MYVQNCTRLYISFAVGMLGRYQDNPGIEHWKLVKNIMRYIQGTKNYVLDYRRLDHLDVIGYSDSDLFVVPIEKVNITGSTGNL